jgi:hypothetical protein
MRIDQLAYYCETEAQEIFVKRLFGLDHYTPITDSVVGEGILFGRPVGLIRARLQFFIQPSGLQFEIMRFDPACEHPFQKVVQSAPFIAHVGVHLEDHEPFPQLEYAFKMKTLGHSNPEIVASGRTYEYRMFAIAPFSVIKYIKRVPPGAHHVVN